MEQKEIIIKIQNDKILFNSKLFVEMKNTSLPKELGFKANEDIYWKVEIKKYDQEGKCLEVEIIDYDPIDKTLFTRQTTTKEIEKLIFTGKYDWAKLCPLLMWHIKNKFVDQLYNIDYDLPFQSSEKNPIQTTPYKIDENFSMNFNDTKFMLGYVTFKKFIKILGREIDFKITNDNILTEFDTIKYWFSKKLKAKRIHVKATISVIGNDVKEITATSKEIDLITDDIIKSIKYSRTMSLIKPPKSYNVDKSLFTADEIFEQIDTEDTGGNVFNQNGQDILDFLITKKSIRNKKELAYLSGSKQSVNYPIRYTLNPNFGFLFLVEGLENNHFIWELLNSNATYIWTFDKPDKEFQSQLKRIESIINTIRSNGREQYKHSYHQTYQDNDLGFRIIKHEDICSEFVDAFPKWKSKLNEQLT
jgi:hypothetical protein